MNVSVLPGQRVFATSTNVIINSLDESASTTIGEFYHLPIPVNSPESLNRHIEMQYVVIDGLESIHLEFNGLTLWSIADLTPFHRMGMRFWPLRLRLKRCDGVKLLSFFEGYKVSYEFWLKIKARRAACEARALSAITRHLQPKLYCCDNKYGPLGSKKTGSVLRF